MAKIGTWSTTPANNNATPPDGWPEGQAPSTVNDCAREMMSAIKVMANSMEYIDLGNTPSFLTATTFSMATADVAGFEVGRRLKLFDATTLYGTVISVSATFVGVRLDSGALTASLSSVAMAVVKNTNNSLPLSVWRRKNLVINSQMDIWQRGNTFVGSATATYTADRFMWDHSGAAVVTISRAATVPTISQAGNFFTSSIVVSVSATDVAIASADYACITYKVEGYDWRQIAHHPMNLSFWAYTTKSGIYAVSLRSGAGSISYVQNFTIDTVSTWQKFSVAVPEAPQTVTWDYSAGVGLQVSWTLAAGGNRQCAAGAWTTMDALATSSQANFLGTANNAFYLTGIQLEQGNWASPFEIRPYQQELESCKRYYQNFPSNPASGKTLFLTNNINAVSELFAGVQLPVEMRAAPTIVSPAFTGGGISPWRVLIEAGTCTVSSMAVVSTNSTQIAIQLFTSLPSGTQRQSLMIEVSAVATAAISISSEL